MTSNADFNGRTEASEVVSAFPESVKQKNILITGVGQNGLGATIAETLATQSPSLLILTGRSLVKVEAVAKSINGTHRNVETRTLMLDMASFESIRAAATKINAYTEKSIDILINNAGVMNIPERTLSADGFEMHLATNYLGAFLFTNSIMSKLTSGGSGRIVNVGSNGYVFSPFRFADYNFDGKELPESENPPKALCESFGLPWGLGYLPTIAYGQSKTAILLYTKQLGKLLGGQGITAVCVHPGAISTDLWRHMPKESVEKLFTMMPMKTHSQGASTTLVAALDPQLAKSSIIYLDNCQPEKVLDFAIDPTNADKLWKLSEELVKESFFK